MYESFLSTFLKIYETNFPCRQVNVKPKDFKKSLNKQSVEKIIYSEAKLVCESLKKTYKRLQKSNLFNKLIKKQKPIFT